MNRKLISLITSFSLVCALFTAPSVSEASSSIPAFPGAEGGGMYATGGRGGKVVHVTNLKDSGSGSFRDAVSGSNRIVVFDVGGTIELKSDVVVKGNVTILGQTAPGGAGVTLKNGKIGMGGDNIIVRFISSRPGEKGSGDYDAWGGSAGSNSIIDHCSIGWANDEQFGLYSKNMNQTVQYCLIGPSDCVSYHSKGAHGFGAMFGKGQNTWHHNMLAHSLSRNFRGKVEKTNSMDFVNNVIYDWGYQTAYGTLGHLNYVNNYLKAGPSTKKGYNFINISSGTAPENYRFYLTGNKMVDKDGSETNNAAMARLNANNWDGGVSYGDAGLTEKDYRVDSPFSVSDVNGNNASYVSKAESPEDAFEHVLMYAGAGISPEQRPKIDRQVMDEARNGTGSLTGGRNFSEVNDSAVLDAIKEYGIQYVDYNEYYPKAILTKEIIDSDNDGMPDDWEIERGLDPNDDSDATGDYLGKGYNNIEYYANDLTVNAFPEGVVEVSLTSVDLGPEYEKIKADLDALTLSTNSIKLRTDLSLPQKGSVNDLDIVWTSSSSAIKISNNQISQVTGSSDDQNVILTANISYGDYNMSKSFVVTVLSNSTFWKASSANNGKPAGTELFDGLTTLFEMTYGTSAVTINNESFSGYVSSADNGLLSNGVASGTAFKYEASEN
ncbi:MAG: dockerin [Oscillospiraceae bacterium]|nr:dockerin [Oscillospiraceae bacterium]